MTKKQILRKLIEAEGDCSELDFDCDDCPFDEHECHDTMYVVNKAGEMLREEDDNYEFDKEAFNEACHKFFDELADDDQVSDAWYANYEVPEMVDHPAHYGGKDNPYEVIKVIEAMGWGRDFCLGNATKYVLRAGKKNNHFIQDIEKAIWYLERVLQQIQEEAETEKEE